MKKILLIMCVCALLLTGAACGKKKDKTEPKDSDAISGGPVTTEKADKETVDLDGDGVSDGVIIEGTPGFDPEEVQPGAVESGSTGDNADAGDTPVISVPDDTMKTETISEGGKDEGLWPTDSVPEDVPAFEEYTEMYPVTHTEGESAEEWYLSFDSTEKDYEDWIAKLESEGYVESDKIVGFWGNGEQILNLMTEDIDGEFCVSIDIFKSKPVEYPEAVSKIFPEFTHTDSTLYGWYIKEGSPNTLSVSYACGKSFKTDLTLYKQKLSDNGFTVTDDSATKTVDGKTYTVRYGDSVSRYEDCLEYEY